MDLADLRCFVRASQLGSFSKTAIALGVAQPTVTRIIAQLELEWEGLLFHRTGRGVVLSELGHEALIRAQSLLRDFDQASEDIRASSRLPSGVVTIGMPTSLVVAVIPTLINQLRVDLPGIRLQVHEGFNDEIERWLAEGSIDIGARSRYREGRAENGKGAIGSPLVLAGLRPGWCLPPEVDFRRLADFALVLPARTNALRTIVDTVARRLKLRLNIVAGVDSMLGQEAIAQRCGCYLVKAPFRSKQGDRGSFASAVIRQPSITRQIEIVTSHNGPLSRASRQVIGRLTQIMKELESSRAGLQVDSRGVAVSK